MPEEKPFTETDSLRARLDAARRRERDARATAARIQREMRTLDRRRETQLLCTLGRAWLSLGERHPAFVERGRAWLAEYISRPTDIDILRGTVWELPAQDAHAVASAEEGGHVGN